MPWLVGVAITWAMNVLTLIVADWAFDGFEVERWWPVIFAGAILGLANTFLRPIVRILAMPLIVVTLGIAYLFVNTLMLLVTEWISPDLSIDGFWTYVGATVVVGLVNWLASTAVTSVVDPSAR